MDAPYGYRRRTPPEQRFWTKVARGEGCWEWTGAICPTTGYGDFSAGGAGSNVGAHRASYELNIGPIPPGLFVLHRCDNRRCVRPDHLFLGTQRDNVRDMIAKGRAAKQQLKGEKHPSAKLTEADVLAIRSSTEDRRTLAEKYGISPATVSDIWRRFTWSHLPLVPGEGRNRRIGVKLRLTEDQRTARSRRTAERNQRKAIDLADAADRLEAAAQAQAKAA